MIDFNNAREFDALMLRVQARRVRQVYVVAGHPVPPKTAAVLEGDTEEARERDDEAFTAWCVDRGVECIAILGFADFRTAAPGAVN